MIWLKYFISLNMYSSNKNLLRKYFMPDSGETIFYPWNNLYIQAQIYYDKL